MEINKAKANSFSFGSVKPKVSKPWGGQPLKDEFVSSSSYADVNTVDLKKVAGKLLKKGDSTLEAREVWRSKGEGSPAFIDEKRKLVVLNGSPPKTGIRALSYSKGEEKWKTDIIGEVTIGPKGFYYAKGKIKRQEDKRIYLIDPANGEVLKTSQSFENPHIVGFYRDKLYITDREEDGPTLIELKADTLEVEKKFKAPYFMYGTMDSKRGVIYFTRPDEGEIHAFDIKRGKDVWKKVFYKRAYPTPILKEDGSVVYSLEGLVVSLSGDKGEEQWKYPLPTFGDTPPKLVASFKSPSGGWKQDVYAKKFPSPVAGNNLDGIYIFDDEGVLHAINPKDGSNKLKYKVGLKSFDAPYPSPDGLVYFQTDKNEIIAFQPEKKEVLWKKKTKRYVWGDMIFTSKGEMCYSDFNRSIVLLENKEMMSGMKKEMEEEEEEKKVGVIKKEGKVVRIGKVELRVKEYKGD